MINDKIISGLTNLFALFGARKGLDIQMSKDTLRDYFAHHFGIRDTELYLNMYEDLRSLYEMDETLDKAAIVNGICKAMTDKMEMQEKALLLLRLMEFCAVTPETFDVDDAMLTHTAACFLIPNEMYHDFCAFVKEIWNDNVKRQTFGGLDGYIKTLWIEEYKQLVFTYRGSDTMMLNDIPILPNVFQTWMKSGVVKVKRSGCLIYNSAIMSPYTEDEELQEIEFSGRDINFRFPNSDNGMHDLSFTLKSGQLLAVMGGSGTGKTTLLSLLNGSLTPQSGTITINGHAISEPSVKALIGFVPQDDLLIEELTVYQNLLFTAKFCFEGMPQDELHQRVMKVLEQLNLDMIKDLKVGSPLAKTISGGQRKRLNIALELIREPAVLFLDEPTSGLSSADTEKVISLLKEQTYKGKLIIVNIHQPSSDVYKMFDRLWLLDKGGYPVFDGNPIEAITYFKGAADYADADSSTCPVCGNVNPEVVLNIIDEKALDSKGMMSNERKITPQAWHKMYKDSQPKALKDAPKVNEVPKTDQKRPNALKQFLIFMQRSILAKFTNRQYVLITLLEAPVLAGICALLTHYSTQEGYTVMDNKNLVSYMFMAVIVSVFIGMSGSAEEIIKDRLLLKREKFLSLSYFSYISSKIVFMAIVVLLQTFLFLIVGNVIQGLSFSTLATNGELFLTWWMIMFAVAFLSGLTGLILSQCLNSIVSIYISIPILLIPQILLCGVVVDFSDLTPKSTTGNVPLIGNVIPSRWAYEAIAVAQYAENEYEKDLFALHKDKYESQYYHHVFLYEIQSQLETMNDNLAKGKPADSNLDVIKKNLPVITDFCKMKPYDGNYSYASLRKYTDEAEDLLIKRANKYVLAEDAIIASKVKSLGKDTYLDIKRRNHNLKLSDIVVHTDSKHTHDVVDGYIVARAGYIYLTPRNGYGSAPFYSSSKFIGAASIPTVWFNMAVLLLMSFIVSIMLYLDYPAKWMRKE